MPKIVCISDTHTRHASLNIPDGDILVHAGDFTGDGAYSEVKDFVDWFEAQPHTHKVLIAGNHELSLDVNLPQYAPHIKMGLVTGGFHYLEDSSVKICGLKFYGTPWTPYIWGAFQALRETDVYLRDTNVGPTCRVPDLKHKLKKVFSRIPDDTDVLVTHGPPIGCLDFCPGGHVGSHELRDRIYELHNLRLVVCGHIHESHGQDFINTDVMVVNASSLDGQYRKLQQPIVVEI